MNSKMSLQELFGIQSSIQYKEFNIIILLDKDKNDHSYPKQMKCYNEEINVIEPASLVKDFMCLVIASTTISNEKTINSIPEGDIYTKRFSGVISSLKLYLEKNKVYSKRYEYTIPKNNIIVPDNRTPYCRLINEDVIVNIFCHNETTIAEVDKSVNEMLGQLVDTAQIKSKQLVVVNIDEQGNAVWSNRKTSTVEELFLTLNENLKQGNYLKTSYDMVNSKQYYFDFTLIDHTLPKKFEKHFVVIGPVKDVQTFSKLNHICSKIRREGETIRMNPITLEDLKAHS